MKEFFEDKYIALIFYLFVQYGKNYLKTFREKKISNIGEETDTMFINLEELEEKAKSMLRSLEGNDLELL